MNSLTAVCEFALTYRLQLPDFVCEQTTTAAGPVWTTVMKAEVTFFKGYEHYSNVTINGKPESNTRFAGAFSFISGGELGSDLVHLFTAPLRTQFKFDREEKLGMIPSLVYKFHLKPEDNTFWALRDKRGTVIHAEYEGELVVSRQDAHLLRLEMHPVHLPGDFGIVSAEITIDYRDVAIIGLGTFLLPATSTTTVCDNMYPLTCHKNVLTFQNCRKFATKTGIITDVPPQ